MKITPLKSVYKGVKTMFQRDETVFWENQRIFVYRLPIDFFYFGDFQRSIYGKITGQNFILLTQFDTRPNISNMMMSLNL